MAAQGFLLIASFLLVLFVIARPLGAVLARLITNIPLPGVTGVERILWRGLGVSQHEMNWKQYLLAILMLNILGSAGAVFPADGAKLVTTESSAATGAVMASCAEYRRELCHQYQLAVLQWRNHLKLL